MINTRLFSSLLLLNLIWGSYYIASKISLQSLSPFFVGLVVRAVTFFLLTVLMITRKEIRQLFKLKGIVLRLFLIGLLGFSLDITAFVGLRLSSAANGAILLKSDVLFANLISIIFLKERFTLRDWLYTLLILFGVTLVMNVDLIHFRFQGVGDVFFLLSAFFVALNAFVIKSVQLDKKNPASDNVIAFYNNLITMVIFFFVLLITREKFPLQNLREDINLSLSLLYAGIMQTLIYVFYYFNLRRLPVWLVKISLLLMPVFATIISFFILGESLNPLQIVGMIVVLTSTAGIIVEQKRKKELKVS